MKSIPSGAVALRRLALLGMLLCLVVVVLGAWVRLTDAGLGCPDWPGCYGHVTPIGAERVPGKIDSYSPGWDYDSGKAWREMIHRYAATTLGFVIVLIAAIAIAYRRERPASVPYTLSLLALVVMQGVLGAFTVWWLVKPLVVVLHLIGGLSTLSMLTWLWLTMRRTTRVVEPQPGATHTRALDSARKAATLGLSEPPLQPLLRAGVVVREADGRIWLDRAKARRRQWRIALTLGAAVTVAALVVAFAISMGHRPSA